MLPPPPDPAPLRNAPLGRRPPQAGRSPCRWRHKAMPAPAAACIAAKEARRHGGRVEWLARRSCGLSQMRRRIIRDFGGQKALNFADQILHAERLCDKSPDIRPLQLRLLQTM